MLIYSMSFVFEDDLYDVPRPTSSGMILEVCIMLGDVNYIHYSFNGIDLHLSRTG